MGLILIKIYLLSKHLLLAADIPAVHPPGLSLRLGLSHHRLGADVVRIHHWFGGVWSIVGGVQSLCGRPSLPKVVL